MEVDSMVPGMILLLYKRFFSTPSTPGISRSEGVHRTVYTNRPRPRPPDPDPDTDPDPDSDAREHPRPRRTRHPKRSAGRLAAGGGPGGRVENPARGERKRRHFWRAEVQQSDCPHGVVSFVLNMLVFSCFDTTCLLF